MVAPDERSARVNPSDVTARLALWAATCEPTDIPETVRHEGVRTVLNWVGCAVGGAGEPTVDRALDALLPLTGSRAATVLGRQERMDVLGAALVNGISSHVLDYDDTHLKTIIHPGGPVVSAALAAAELRPVDGRRFLAAVIVGVEACCRIGNSVYPEHYDRGWHITGTAGVFGGAVAAGRILGLDPRRMNWALGLAATQASGIREMFGTMTKSFHPGRAAQGGLLAAFLAEAGFDSSERAIEAPRGFAHVLSTRHDPGEITNGLGERWEAALNSYKPFACGIVIHPTIDGCIQLRAGLEDRWDEVESVVLHANPLVLELTGKRTPSTGLEGKFSVFHAAAAALLLGDGSPTAFTDEVVRDPRIVSLRERVAVTPDPAVHEASATVTVTLRDGEQHRIQVDRAVGSIERPLGDDALDGKFLGQVVPVLGAPRSRELLDLCRHLPELESVHPLTVAAVPGR